MTYEQYWYGDPWMTRAYVQAHLLKRKIQNENMWIMGSYMANAFGVVIANAFSKKRLKYFDKPMEIFPKTEAEKKAEVREEKRKLITYLNGLSKVFKKKNTGSDQDGEPGNT